MLKENGFLYIKINREEVGIIRDHISEVELGSLPGSAWEHMISNNESFEQFCETLVEISKNLESRM
jgi:hypothetical protein